MKKHLLVMINFVSIYCSAQVRLNEVFPANNGINRQWIELFASTGVVDNYKILVKYKTSVTDSGFYVFSISGTPNANKYLVIENNGGINWINTSSVKKVRWDGTNISFTAVESNEILAPSSSNYIFLLRGNVNVDALVTGESNYSTAQKEMNSWTKFNVPNGIGLDGLSADFKFVQLTNLNTMSQSSGSNSTFSFLYGQNGCVGTFPWVKINAQTKGTQNSGSAVPNFDYWDIDYKISKTFTRAPADFYNIPNNIIPTGSPTFDYFNGLPITLHFKYSLSNTLLNATTDIPGFRFYYDKGGANGAPNELLDVADPELVLNINRSLESSNSVYVTVPISPDMFFLDQLGNKKLRPLFSTLSSSNACFATQNILLSDQLVLLPISLKEFTVNKLEKKIKLNWVTVAEYNNKGFEIQRSLETPDNFKSIGFVGTDAKSGNSQSTINYYFDDIDISFNKKYYYRLKQIDFDGKFSFSPIRTFNIASSVSKMYIYPNPSSGTVSVYLGTQGRFNLYLHENSGKEVNSYMNITTPILKINNLRPGFYTLKIVNLEDGEQSIRHLIVN